MGTRVSLVLRVHTNNRIKTVKPDIAARMRDKSTATRHAHFGNAALLSRQVVLRVMVDEWPAARPVGCHWAGAATNGGFTTCHRFLPPRHGRLALCQALQLRLGRVSAVEQRQIVCEVARERGVAGNEVTSTAVGNLVPD